MCAPFLKLIGGKSAQRAPATSGNQAAQGCDKTLSLGLTHKIGPVTPNTHSVNWHIGSRWSSCLNSAWCEARSHQRRRIEGSGASSARD